MRPEGVKLNCTADANPAPNLYEFLSNNNKIGESSNGIFELSSTTLSFQNTIKCLPYNQYWVGHAAVLVIVVHGKLIIDKIVRLIRCLIATRIKYS